MKIAILSGPTATGKTQIALELAERLKREGKPALEIVNADSMLVYRGMNVGTAKPAASELEAIPHHLIDIRDPDEAYTAGDFVREAEQAIAGVLARGHQALMVGGTGFYLKALLYGLWETPPSTPALREKIESLSSPELYALVEKRDPESALRIGVNDRYRLVRAMEMIEAGGKSPSEHRAAARHEPDPRFELLVVDRDDAELEPRIADRAARMVDGGLVEEVRGIRASHPGARALMAVGYAETCEFLDGQTPKGRKPKPGLAGLTDEITLATRQLVKRQRTWFRSERSARWFILEKDRAELDQRLWEIYAS